MNRKTYLTIFVFALLTRIAGIWIPSLWYDENFTLILARLPFDKMILATAGDVHPPLWYLVEWIWMHVLNDPAVWTLRIPALVFSMLAVVSFRHLLDELEISERIQIAAMSLMAVMPMQIWYAQEARMYSLLEWLVIITLLFALRREWVKLYFAAVAMLYTQNYSVFYLACIGLIVFVEDMYYYSFARELGPKINIFEFKVFTPTMRTALAMSTALLVYSPWLKVLSSQMDYIGGRYWIQPPHIGDVLNMIYRLFWFASMPSFAMVSAMLVTFMAVSLGIIHVASSGHVSRRRILIMAFGPLFMAWAVSMIWHPILLHRALIGCAPFLYLLVAWPLDQLLDERNQVRHWREAVIVCALAIPVIISGIGGYYRNIPTMKTDGAVSPLIDALVYVKEHWQDGDVIYYTDDGPAVNLLPYAGELPQYGMSACGKESYGLVLGSLNPSTREAMGFVVRDLSEIAYKRAWVFAPRSPLHPKCYEEQIDPLTLGDPLITVDDNIFIESGVWLVER